MENIKPEGKVPSDLHLGTRVSFIELTNPAGEKTLTARVPDGRAEIIYDKEGYITKATRFFDNNEPQIFTDPESLAEIDKQVQGLLGEHVDEDDEYSMGGAVQDGPVSSAAQLKVKMVQESMDVREALQQYGRQYENPKGH